MAERKVQKEFDKLLQDLKDKKFKYEPKETKSIDWASYDLAQLHEINEQLLLVRRLVDEAAERLGTGKRENGVGKPPKSAADKAKAILVQQYFGVSNRLAAGLMILFDDKLGIEEEFTYKTIERAYGDSKVIQILELVFELTNEPVADKETKFSIDGSGMPRSVKQNWAQDKDDDEKCAGYDKMVGMIGTTYKLYSAVSITSNGNANESPFFVPLLERTAELYETIELVCGDRAFPSKANCTAVENLGALPRIYPKKGAVLKQRGSHARKKMLLDFVEDLQSWLRDYHNRSISETGNTMWKGKFPKKLMKRLVRRRETEAFARFCSHNILRLNYISWLFDINVRWFKAA